MVNASLFLDVELPLHLTEPSDVRLRDPPETYGKNLRGFGVCRSGWSSGSRGLQSWLSPRQLEGARVEPWSTGGYSPLIAAGLLNRGVGPQFHLLPYCAELIPIVLAKCPFVNKVPRDLPKAVFSRFQALHESLVATRAALVLGWRDKDGRPDRSIEILLVPVLERFEVPNAPSGSASLALPVFWGYITARGSLAQTAGLLRSKSIAAVFEHRVMVQTHSMRDLAAALERLRGEEAGEVAALSNPEVAADSRRRKEERRDKVRSKIDECSREIALLEGLMESKGVRGEQLGLRPGPIAITSEHREPEVPGGVSLRLLLKPPGYPTLAIQARPGLKESSFTCKLRLGWTDVRSYLAEKPRYDTYYYTDALSDREAALALWNHALDPSGILIPSSETIRRVRLGPPPPPDEAEPGPGFSRVFGFGDASLILSDEQLAEICDAPMALVVCARREKWEERIRDQVFVVGPTPSIDHLALKHHISQSRGLAYRSLDSKETNDLCNQLTTEGLPMRPGCYGETMRVTRAGMSDTAAQEELVGLALSMGKFHGKLMAIREALLAVPGLSVLPPGMQPPPGAASTVPPRSGAAAHGARPGPGAASQELNPYQQPTLAAQHSHGHYAPLQVPAAPRSAHGGSVQPSPSGEGGALPFLTPVSPPSATWPPAAPTPVADPRRNRASQPTPDPPVVPQNMASTAGLYPARTAPPPPLGPTLAHDRLAPPSSSLLHAPAGAYPHYAAAFAAPEAVPPPVVPQIQIPPALAPVIAVPHGGGAPRPASYLPDAAFQPAPQRRVASCSGEAPGAKAEVRGGGERAGRTRRGDRSPEDRDRPRHHSTHGRDRRSRSRSRSRDRGRDEDRHDPYSYGEGSRHDRDRPRTHRDSESGRGPERPRTTRDEQRSSGRGAGPSRLSGRVQLGSRSQSPEGAAPRRDGAARKAPIEARLQLKDPDEERPRSGTFRPNHGPRSSGGTVDMEVGDERGRERKRERSPGQGWPARDDRNGRDAAAAPRGGGRHRSRSASQEVHVDRQDRRHVALTSGRHVVLVKPGGSGAGPAPGRAPLASRLELSHGAERPTSSPKGSRRAVQVLPDGEGEPRGREVREGSFAGRGGGPRRDFSTDDRDRSDGAYAAARPQPQRRDRSESAGGHGRGDRGYDRYGGGAAYEAAAPAANGGPLEDIRTLVDAAQVAPVVMVDTDMIYADIVSALQEGANS